MRQYWERQRPGFDKPTYRPRGTRCLNCDYETTEDELEENDYKCPSCDTEEYEFR